MSRKVIEINNLGKQYRLGQVGTSTLSDDFKRWLYKLRGKEDPFLKVGETNDRTKKGNSEYVWALKNISFSVNQGEVLGIIGKNGAGKSTLLKILSRTTNPSIGEYKIKGRVASLLEVGTGFHPDLSGRENVFLNGAIMGMNKAEIKKQFDAIVDFSGVERYIDTPVKRYSSGMYVRLAFAVAAHLEPEILIVDEVLAVGDQEFQDKCLGKMKSVSGEGRTVLFVSHNMAAVKTLCKRSIVMKTGQIYFDGNVTEGISKYLEALNPSLNNGVIEKHHRTINTGKVLFNDIKVKNEEFKTGNSIYFNKAIQLDLILEFLESFNDIWIDLRINSNDGVEVFHGSTLYQRDLLNVAKGNLFVSVSIENKLQPGKYFITLGVHKSDGATLDYLENVLELNILNVTDSNDKGLIYDFKLAYARLNSTWQIKN